MIKVIVHHNHEHGCWYINEVSDSHPSTGKVGFKTREEALTRARRDHPYVGISVEE